MRTLRPQPQTQQLTTTLQEQKELIPNIAPQVDPIIDPDVAQTLLQNERFIIAVDSYRLGLCNMIQAMHMAFLVPPFFPENTSIFAFNNFVMETARRIIRDDIIISEELKTKFKSFYDQQIINPEEV